MLYSNLLHILIIQILQWREVTHLDPLRLHKHAVIWRAIKVALAIDAPVVLPRGLIELNAHPQRNRPGVILIWPFISQGLECDFRNRADVLDRSSTEMRRGRGEDDCSTGSGDP